MDSEMLKALKSSIASWKKRRETDDWGHEGCALCDHAGELRPRPAGVISRCSFCVIGQLDGAHYCYNTPYRKASEAFNAWLEKDSDETLEAWHKAADAEIAFLESLLPNGPG